MIPPAVREITEREASSITLGDPRIAGRLIYRSISENIVTYATSAVGRTLNRNRATIYPSYGRTPGGMDPELIVEFLPDEVVIPPAVQEISYEALHEYFDQHHLDDPQPDILTRRLIVRKEVGVWRSSEEEREDSTSNRNEAYVFPSFGQTNGYRGDGFICELLPFEGEDYNPAEVQQPKKVSLMFPPDFIRLMEAAPKNEMVRGWILKVTKQMPPEDIDTVDKLEAWINTLPEPKAPATTPPRAGLSIPVSVTQTDIGRINYSVSQAATVPFRFADEELRRMVQGEVEEGGDMESLAKVLSDKISNDIWDHDINWADDRDMDYGDRNSTDSEESDYEYNSDRLQEMMEHWIRANMPDAVEPLGI